MHTHSHTSRHTHTLTYTHMQRHTHRHTYTHTQTHSHIHTDTYTNTLTHNTHIHSHTHTLTHNTHINVMPRQWSLNLLTTSSQLGGQLSRHVVGQGMKWKGEFIEINTTIYIAFILYVSDTHAHTHKYKYIVHTMIY